MNPHSYRLLELVPHSEFGPSAFYGYSVTSKVGYMTLWGGKNRLTTGTVLFVSEEPEPKF